MKRVVFVALLVGIVAVAVSTGCSWFKHEEVQFTFENRTGSALCLYGSQNDASSGECLDDVQPRDDDRPLIYGCGDGPGVENNPITVVITVRETGREIYDRTALCRVWQDSERTFIIEQRGDEFVVTEPRGLDVKP